MPLLDLREAARREMPAVDCPPELVLAAQNTWRGRMINEHGSAVVFEGLAAQLASAGAKEAAGRCLEFADEERRHGVLCGAVVEALGGEARAEVSQPELFPAHADAAPLEAALRNLLSVSCLSETVAVSLIGAERLEMPEGELRALLTRIYAEECGHCNFGWRLLGEILPDDPDLKARLGEYLVYAFRHLERHELSHLPEAAKWPASGAAVGLCSGGDARALFYETVAEVILPGLEARGIPARAAWDRRRG